MSNDFLSTIPSVFDEATSMQLAYNLQLLQVRVSSIIPAVKPPVKSLIRLQGLILSLLMLTCCIVSRTDHTLKIFFQFGAWKITPTPFYAIGLLASIRLDEDDSFGLDL